METGCKNTALDHGLQPIDRVGRKPYEIQCDGAPPPRLSWPTEIAERVDDITTPQQSLARYL